jgi:hypothetical protein
MARYRLTRSTFARGAVYAGRSIRQRFRAGRRVRDPTRNGVIAYGFVQSPTFGMRSNLWTAIEYPLDR